MASFTRFGTETCSDLNAALQLEWLETNGVGGYACSTVSGAHTRRHHGLLVAALLPPVRRMVLLSKLEEVLRIGDSGWELSTNIYPGAVHPAGYLLLKEFQLRPFPSFTFESDSFELRKTVLMIRGENTTLIRYDLLRSAAPARLELRPLIAVRESGGLIRENSNLNPRFASSGNQIILQPYAGVPPFQLSHNALSVREEGHWYRSFQFPQDMETGYPAQEDLFNPCSLAYLLSPEAPAWLLASTKLSEYHDETAAGLHELEQFRRRNLSFADRQGPKTELEETLLRTADQFVVRRTGDRVSILAGYPWLTDSGREAMISLPGLTLVTDRWEEARKILLSLARDCVDGLIPSRYPESGSDPEYESNDSGLWFVYGVDRYLRYTGDFDTVRDELYPVVRAVLRACRDGTRHGARMDEDGLIVTAADRTLDASASSPPGTASVKWVDTQALWYNALSTATFLAQNIHGPKPAREYSEPARLCRGSFNQKFWNREEQCLFDCLRDDVPDPAIRPNQLLAVSLPDSMLNRKQVQQVVRRVEKEFLVGHGLGGFAGSDPMARSRLSDPACEGAKGSVWSWLTGFHAAAYLRAFGKNEKSLTRVRALLDPFWEHLREAGVGSVSERFDGEPPHAPRGCPAHAAAVAEVLRVYCEAFRKS